MQRFPRSAASVSIAVLAASAIAPPAIAAATAPPPARYETRGLLDGLLGIDLGQLLGTLLGSGQQAQLQQLIGLLQGGTRATPDVLSPLTSILTSLGAAQGLPGGTQALVQELTSLLNAGRAGVPLDPSLLAPVSGLLRQLAATQGLPAAASTLLNQLADLLSNSGAGLPIGSLPLDTGSLAGLQSVLGNLLRGQQPTGALLAPIIPLLRQVAATPGVPPALSSLINQLIDTIQRTTGALDPLVTSQLSSVLSLIGNTPGVSRETRTIIERTTTALSTQTQTGGDGPGGGSGGTTGGSGGTTGGGGKTTPGGRRATARDRAVVKRVTVNGKRTVASVRVACPRSAPATCVTTVGATLRGARAAAATRVRVSAGGSKVVKLRISRAARRTLRNSGGTLSVSATTAFGTQRFTAKGTVTVRRTR